MQSTFEWLFKKSSEKRTKGIDLYKIITYKSNILLAYRMIKSNRDSKTAGTDELTIDNFKSTKVQEFIDYIRKELSFNVYLCGYHLQIDSVISFQTRPRVLKVN